MSQLFTPIKFRDLEFKNRIFVSPMCQYSSVDGMPNDWHLVHLGSRAIGGAGLVITEAVAVTPEGRISPDDAGLWNDEQAEAFRPITEFIKSHGARAGVQLAHAGRKASTAAPWNGGKSVLPAQGGWLPIAPSALRFSPESLMPKEMSKNEIKNTVEDFVKATHRSLKAGFEVIEIHMAHGYLLNEFLTPLSNHRHDEYGGSIENRMRFPLEVARAMRNVWPVELPMFVRISASDWIDGGWTIQDSVVFAKELKKLGIDLIDCSSGGNSPTAKINAIPGYQVPFAEQVRREANIATGAVGLITEAKQAEEILRSEKADVIFMARELLRDPYWPLHAARMLGVELKGPKQYGRALNSVKPTSLP